MPTPGRLILPDDIRPLGELERYTGADGLRFPEPLKFAPSDAAQDYVFFNHGVLFSHSNLVDDPLGDWHETLDQPTTVLKQAFREPLFDGLNALTFDNRVPWNRVLCGVHKNHWDDLLEYLSGICISDPRQRSVQLVYYGLVEILDPSYVDQYGWLRPGMPTIECYVFCLSGNQARHEFLRPMPITRRPQLHTMPPTPALVEMGQKMSYSDLDPLVHRHNPAHRDFLLAYQAALRRGPIIETQP